MPLDRAFEDIALACTVPQPTLLNRNPHSYNCVRMRLPHVSRVLAFKGGDEWRICPCQRKACRLPVKHVRSRLLCPRTLSQSLGMQEAPNETYPTATPKSPKHKHDSAPKPTHWAGAPGGLSWTPPHQRKTTHWTKLIGLICPSPPPSWVLPTWHSSLPNPQASPAYGRAEAELLSTLVYSLRFGRRWEWSRYGHEGDPANAIVYMCVCIYICWIAVFCTTFGPLKRHFLYHLEEAVSVPHLGGLFSHKNRVFEDSCVQHLCLLVFFAQLGTLLGFLFFFP